MPLLKVKNLKKHYPQRRQVVKALDGISFTVAPGEVLGVIGESGCGKSTLGKLIAALETPTDGEIFLAGQPMATLERRDRLAFRRRVQMIFQNPFDVFDPRIRLGRSLLDALKIHRIGDTQAARMTILEDLLTRVHMVPVADYLGRYPAELSGGQLQRLAILRSMLLEPELLVADEAVSMLDVSIRADILSLMTTLQRARGTAIIFISHDLATTAKISDRILVMYLGKIVEIGTTDEIVEHPRHPYTKVLLSHAYVAGDRAHRALTIPGEPPTPINTGPGCYFAPRCPFATDRCRREYPPFEKVNNEHEVSCFYWKNIETRKEG